MAKLEELKPGVHIRGLIPGDVVSVIDAQWHGSAAVELTYKQANGDRGAQLLFRGDEGDLALVETVTTWSFSADGDAFKLAAEAYRIHLAHLFDPVLAVHTSLIEPLPHQITAVYGEMLTRQPLRYLLADDPGAGKTIMAGLLIKELMVRGDVERCLICVPGNLAAQWQDELWFKFQLRFDILTRDTYDAAATGNAFEEHDRAIIRLDQVARSEELQEQLSRTDWDLVVVDEAHKMSAHYWGQKLEETRRYKLGKLLRDVTRHFLLMTATPHNGKTVDFQLFMALLDQDRFEGRYRSEIHDADVSDLMRRMVKEELVRFDERPLFPERRAYTVNYPLSQAEAQLYDDVTEYVRNEFNRADQLADDKHRGTVGFALMILQRRLASSPAAIYHSLRRRRERLEAKLQEARDSQMGSRVTPLPSATEDERRALHEADFWEEFADEAPAEELEDREELIIDSATTATTIAELETEIAILKGLEQTAYRVRHSGADRKWEELASILQADADAAGPGSPVSMIDEHGRRRKLVIFTEHRDTLTYLRDRIATLFGRDEMIVTIHGSVPRPERRAVEERFRNDPAVAFLLATDAAAEGINLQRAHLMINYDLPWNPNRLEQRFGRIHRIGQSEVCHLWNLVSAQTREGAVYARLLQKLATENAALQGKVFDILGELFDQTPLRRLLVDAIRYGDQPEVRARLEQAVDDAVDQDRVRDLLETRSLATETMDTSEITRIREEMERYAARRLQPYYIRAFFIEAFSRLGGKLYEREPERYQISHVPARIRHRAKALGTAVPVLETYERVCFDKALIHQSTLPEASFLCPGHPLLDTVIDMSQNRLGNLLRDGTVLVDPADPGTTPRVLIFLEQRIRDQAPGYRRGAPEYRRGGAADGTGATTGGRLISQEVHFVEVAEDGAMRSGGAAPYLDYAPATSAQRAGVADLFQAGWLSSHALDAAAIDYAVEHLIPAHLARVRKRREELIDKTLKAVHARLTWETNHWDGQAAGYRLKAEESRGPRKLGYLDQARRSQERADALAARLEARTQALERARHISAAPPVVIGGALVVPIGLLLGERTPKEIIDTRITEQIAMQAVLKAEAELGFYPRDVSRENLGYDIESRDPASGHTRFIEVKGRRAGARDVTVTKNEILTGFNQPEQYILALVEVRDGRAATPRYVREPFRTEPGFGVVSVNYNLRDLLALATGPA